jgi:hypothetical protein
MKILLHSRLLLFLIFFTPSAVIGQFGIFPSTNDYCTSGNVTFTIGNPDPNKIYTWYLEDYEPTTFSVSGQPIVVPYGMGTSMTIYIGATNGSVVRVTEMDQIGNLTGVYAQHIVYFSNMLSNIPTYHDLSGCGTIVIPQPFNDYSWGRWTQWYVNGVPSTVTGNAFPGPFNGAVTLEFKIAGTCGDTLSTGPFVVNGPLAPVIAAMGSTTFCQGDSVRLELQNSPGTITGWKLNNVTIPQTANKTFIYAKTSGNYTIVTSTTNGAGGTCQQTSAPIAVTMNTGASITGNATGCTGDSVLLTTTAASSYTWYRNGVAIIGGNTQSIYVKLSGNYHVVSTGLACNTSAVKTVTFYPKATVAVTPAGTLNMCSGNAITLTASGTNITSYSWYRNNAVMPGGNTASITVTKNGSYKCIVANVLGCTKTSNTVQIVIPSATALPVTSLVLQPDTNGIDAYVTTAFGLTSTNYGSAQFLEISNWYKHFRTAERALMKFDLSMLPAGTKIVSASLKLYADTFKVYNNTAQTLFVKRVIVPWGEHTLTYYQPHDSTDFQYASVTSASITSKSYVNIAITDLVKHWITLPAQNYGMMLHMNEFGQQPSWLRIASSDYTVNSKRPKLTVSYNYAKIDAGGPLNLCTGGSVTFTTNTGTYNYQWYKNGLPVAGATTVNYTATTPGIYKVVISNSAGCSVTSAERTVTQNAAPVAAISPSGSASFCYNSSLILTADSIAGYTSFQWKRNNIVIAGATLRKYTATQAGTYSVTVTNNCGATATASVVCTVITNPAPFFTASGPLTFCNGQSVTFTANTFAGVTYQWRKNSVDIAGATAQNYVATTAGSYAVRETANGCSRTSGSVTVTVNCRMSELEAGKLQTVIYPQPFSGAATILLQNGNDDFTSVNFILTDLNGRWLRKFPCTGTETLFERQDLPAGMYFLQTNYNGNAVNVDRIMIAD